MKKGGLGTFVPKITLGLMLLCLSLVILGGSKFAVAGGGVAGTFWIEPQTQTVEVGDNITLEVFVNSGGTDIRSYGVGLEFDPNFIYINPYNLAEDNGTNATDPYPDAIDAVKFVKGLGLDMGNVTSTSSKGILGVSQASISGSQTIPGGTSVKLFEVKATAIKAGTTTLLFDPSTLQLFDPSNTAIAPNLTGVGATVTIKSASPPPTPQHRLSVTVNGPGSVTSSPAGIHCPSTCTHSYDDGTSVTLTATADNQATFVKWSGACTGTGNCVVTMDADKSVTATFVGPGTVGFKTSATTTYENVGNLLVQVCRTNGTSGAASVHFYTVDDSAKAGMDYTRSEGTLNWANGEEGCKTISVPIIDNSDEDGTKTFSIRLNNITGAASGATTLAVTIRDDEAVTAVPTINEWGMIIFTLILMGSGAYYLRKQHI